LTRRRLGGKVRPDKRLDDRVRVWADEPSRFTKHRISVWADEPTLTGFDNRVCVGAEEWHEILLLNASLSGSVDVRSAGRKIRILLCRADPHRVWNSSARFRGVDRRLYHLTQRVSVPTSGVHHIQPATNLTPQHFLELVQLHLPDFRRVGVLRQKRGDSGDVLIRKNARFTEHALGNRGERAGR